MNAAHRAGDTGCCACQGLTSLKVASDVHRKQPNPSFLCRLNKFTSCESMSHSALPLLPVQLAFDNTLCCLVPQVSDGGLRAGADGI